VPGWEGDGESLELQQIILCGEKKPLIVKTICPGKRRKRSMGLGLFISPKVTKSTRNFGPYIVVARKGKIYSQRGWMGKKRERERGEV